MVVSFITEQGGVGKSSLCFNLAWLLSTEHKKKILIIDLDSQGGNVSFFAKVTDREDKKGIIDIIEQDVPINETIIKLNKDLSIIPANGNAQFIQDAVNRKKYGNPMVLKNIIDEIKEEYDYIFIDTNPTPSIIHVMSLIASDRLIIPFIGDEKSIEATQHILDTYDGIKKEVNQNLEVLGVVYNKFKPRIKLGKRTEEEIRKICDKKQVPFTEVRINDAISVGESVVCGIGITEYEPKGKVSEKYRNLVAELFDVK